jgi:hypothetical protein
MTIELDDLDKDFLARSHTPDEWRRECKDALERNALYFRRILELMDQVTALKAEVAQLRGQRAGCAYPNCLDGGGRCQAMFKGECAGPNQRRTTI